jgi:phytoene desaturase
VPGRKFVIVGAGLGGLAAALRLAHRGEEVVVLEKTDQVGGRNRPEVAGQCKFDAGPTLVMMLEPFYGLFSDVGEDLSEHLTLKKCDPSYRVFYADGSRLDATTEVDRMALQIESLGAGPDIDGFRRLLEDLNRLYADAIPHFVRKNFTSPIDFFGPRQLGLVARHRMLANLAKRVERYVRDPRLRMLFSFQAMYLGLSPFEAPWVYAVLTHMEYGEGIWYPQGGVAEISAAIARLAERKGAKIRLGAEVERIEGKTVQLKSGEAVSGDAVICNADLPYAERALLGRPPKRGRRYSCSAFVMAIDYAGELPDLLHHNVFFGSDFPRNLEQIFTRRELPDDPAFYAAISARSDSDQSRPGHENLYILVPCPNLDRPWTSSDACELRRRAFRRLQKEVGFQHDRVAAMTCRSPADWASELNLERGAAFGLSHHFGQSAFFRPPNKDRLNSALYYVGASTIPGNGMPMVLISAELLEQRLAADGLLDPQGQSPNRHG